MNSFYRNLVENMTNTAENDRRTLIQYYENKERNKNYTVGYLNDYPPSSNLRNYHSWEFPDFCDQYDFYCVGVGQIDRRASDIHLIIDHLCIPAWTGIVVCKSIKKLIF